MKRSEHFYGISNKRAKLQQDIDDIWGDDPEIDEVDRCINLATQLCSQNIQHRVNDTFNSTSYDDFKAKPNISSTPAFFPPAIPSTSGGKITQVIQLSNNTSSVKNTTVVTRDASDEEIRKLLQKIQSLDTEKKKLTQMYETKNGEIAILRSQLKQAQNSINNEKMEKLKIIQENQQKFDSKLNGINKVKEGFKCELDLKKLELANLREKLTELKKVYNSNLNMTILTEELHATQMVYPTNKINGLRDMKKTVVTKNSQTEFNNYFYPITSGAIYPLKKSIPHTIFEKCLEKNSTLPLTNNRINLSFSYGHNFTTLLGNETSSKLQEDNLICINCLHPDIQKLMNCTEEELNNSDNVFNFIQYILNMTENGLSKLLSKLYQINEKLTYEDVENMNNFYLEDNIIQYQSDCIFSGTLWHDNESTIDIRRYIAILSTLVCHCEKLHKYFITTQTSNNNDSNDMQMEIDEKMEYKFLNLILECVTIIKNIRRSEQFCGLVSAILKLLSNLSSKGSLPTECYEIINQIFKQIIFLRPSKPILKYVCEFLKYISLHYLFIEKLCIMKKCETTQSSLKDGLFYFSEDSCAFRILSTELETCELNIEMACNVIQFLKNSVTCNVFWMYHQEEQRCECLTCVYSLGIDILYNAIEKKSERFQHIEDTTKERLHYTIFRVGLIFLDILTARILDLVVRCSRLLSEYQTIIKYINKIQKNLCMEKCHEIALENLVSQLNSDVQRKSHNQNVDHVLNTSFTSF